MADISEMAADLEKAMAAWAAGLNERLSEAGAKIAAAGASVNSPYYGIVADSQVTPNANGVTVRVRVEPSGGPGQVHGGIRAAMAASEAAVDEAAKEAGLDRRR